MDFQAGVSSQRLEELKEIYRRGEHGRYADKCLEGLAESLAWMIVDQGLELDNLSDPIYGQELSRLEKKVVGMVAIGLHHEEVMKRLSVAESTVQRALIRVRRKLGVDTNTQAIRVAVVRGLIDG